MQKALRQKENGELNLRALYAQLVLTKAVTTKVILLRKKKVTT